MASKTPSRIGSPIAATSFGTLLFLALYRTALILPPSVRELVESSPKNILFVALHFTADLLLCLAFYRLTLHPLAKYPGPWLAALTDWYNVYHCSTGSRHIELYRIHLKYGTFVRFGPNRVSVNSVEGLRDIYSVSSNNQKSTQYLSFMHFFKVPMSMITIDRKLHARKRRIVNRALTTAVESEDHILKNVRNYCNKLGEDEQDNGWTSPKDMTKIIMYMASDIMGDMTFSKNWNMLNSEENRFIVDLLPKGVQMINMSGYMPGLLALKLDQIFFRPMVKQVMKFEALSRDQADWRVAQKQVKTRDLFAGLLEAKDPETGKGLTHEELVSEAGLLIIAGSDTSAIATASTFFYLLHYPEAFERVKKEIRDTFQDLEEIRASAKLTSCSFLFACITESLRLSPSVPGILPRTTLAGGIVAHGEHFPPGVDLGVPIYAVHHDPTCYPDPFVFKPERWLPECSTPEELSRANSAFSAFGVGRTSCVGKAVAYQQISTVVARTIWLYDLRLKTDEPEPRLGEGSQKFGYGRKLKNEFQLYEHFTSTPQGPLVEFKRVVR